jgi:hypothetical protein
MGTGWIDNIFNNSKVTWHLKSVDDRHHGALSGGGTNFALDDQSFHALRSDTHYRADWCGIPWYFEGKHFKVLSLDQKKGVLFYTSEIGGTNWLMYEELVSGRRTGLEIARQSVPKGSDFHCNLRFEVAGVFIDVVNNNAFSGENAVYQVLSETREWMQVGSPIIASAIQASAV